MTQRYKDTLYGFLTGLIVAMICILLFSCEKQHGEMARRSAQFDSVPVYNTMTFQVQIEIDGSPATLFVYPGRSFFRLVTDAPDYINQWHLPYKACEWSNGGIPRYVERGIIAYPVIIDGVDY